MEKVKEMKLFPVKEVDASDLTVWRCIDRSFTFDTKDRETFGHQIQGDFSTQKVEKLGLGENIAGLNVSEKEILFVQMPGAFPALTFYAVRYSQVTSKNLVFPHRSREQAN
jgi:hypothetical protein